MSVRNAKKLYETFHQFEPIRVAAFRKGFIIPKEIYYVGDAKTMLYASDKFNPISGDDEGWIHYFHDHKPGARMYLTDDDQGGELRNTPRWVWDTKALTLIGDCEGWEYKDFDGEVRKAEATQPLPEWYAIPSGKALLVVQSKRKVLAVVWGGSLNVEWRGVVG